MRVNFNYEAASTHTAYLVNQREMGKSLLRLSTGMRILEASDDAAGLFIADQLSLVATGLQEGNRNISTGISALRIAENASGQIFDRLKGIYSRAIRAANDINDPNARAALQREVANLIDAIQKIGTDTEYNGIKLLDGTFQNKYIHYGARMDQVVNVSIADVRAQSLGAYIAQGMGAAYVSTTAAASGGDLTTLLTAGALSGALNFKLDAGDYVRINGTTVYQYSGTPELVDAAKLAKNINENANLKAIGIEAKAVNTSVANPYTNPVTVTDTPTTGSATIDLKFYVGDGTKTFTITGFATVNGGSVTTMGLDELVSQINSKASANGVPIVAMNDGGRLKLVTTNGETIAIEATVNVVTAADAGTINIDYSQLLEGASTTPVSHNYTAAATSYSAAVKVGRVTIAANETFNLAYGGVSGTGEGLNFDITTGSSATFSNLYTIDLSTNAGAERALMIVSKALQKVDTIRSQIGAVMNNLQSIFDAQKVSYDNTKQAENVIRNTDYAEEMSNFTSLQIKMQSTIAMLAQANALPQLVLQLLR
ncbi:flagellin [Thermocrinis sp.]|uniref:flagellin N-terminal helical domain-containing protein n=1 Tax=Thermocrinis sp. TaxID=2024383 RepID=UPI0026306AA1|nr:flagellin [Thermocrinis sp.]